MGESPWVVIVAVSLATVIALIYFLWFMKVGNRFFHHMQEKMIAHKVEEFLRRSE